MQVLDESPVLFNTSVPPYLDYLITPSSIATEEFTLELAESSVRLIKKLKGGFDMISHTEARDKASVFDVLGMRTGWVTFFVSV